MKILKHIPNAITCGNLLCGTLAVIQIFEGQLTMACYLVFLAAVLDFFDGFAARILKVASPIGKDLDSLADLVTFGLVPGLLMYKLIGASLHISPDLMPQFILGRSMATNGRPTVLAPLLALTIPVLSAVRLARFNHDTRQTGSFIGLPTPSLALFVTSGVLYLSQGHQPAFTCTTWFLVSLSMLLAALLNAEIPLFALKFKNFSFRGNEIRYVFLFSAFSMLIITGLAGISLTILLYILFSIVNNLLSKEQV
jgi:CDP-diacylglycerol--serine O-phosphatidyltransferase